MKNIKILLIEDNPDHAELFQYHIRASLGSAHELLHVTTLGAGIQALSGRPDIVFLDLKLPDSSYPKDTVDQFLKYAVDVPVIVLTSLSDEEMGSWAIQSGAQDYLAKDSVTKNALTKSIRFALERQTFIANMRQTNLELQESNKQLERFAYVASHDLQEPLRKINSFSQAVIEDCGPDITPKAKGYLEIITTAATRMTHMIDDLLDLSRVERRTLSIEATPLEEVITAALDNLDLAVQDAGAEIEFSDLPTIGCDRALFIHLFQNIIGNAIKFRRADIKPHVTIRAQVLKDLVKISFSDNGIGISDANKKKIFDVFQRLHSHTQYPGTGIGLAICKKIVERHDGKIWVESTLNDGSTFFVSIPKLETYTLPPADSGA